MFMFIGRSRQKYDYFLNGGTFINFTDHKSLIYLDQREFNNAKIRRWQEEISSYRFVLEYIQGETNLWADMLSRSRDVDKTKCKPDNSAAGRIFRLRDTGLHIYVPSWCTGDIDNAQLTQVHHTQQNTNACKNFTGAFLALSSEVDSVTDNLCEQINIAVERSLDETLAKIIKTLHNGKLDKKFEIDTQDHRASIFMKHIDKFYLEPGTSILMLRDSNKAPKLVVPYRMRSAYLHQAHDCINH